MLENKLQVFSIQEQLNSHQQQIKHIEEERAKATEKFDTDIATHQAIVDFLKSKLSKSPSISASVIINPIAQTSQEGNSEKKKRVYTMPGVVEKGVLAILKDNLEGMTVPELNRTLEIRGIKVSLGAVDNNVKGLLEDGIIKKLNPEDKVGVKYGLAK